LLRLVATFGCSGPRAFSQIAEPLHQRALAIREKALGPEHPDVAQSLENYAALLRGTARADEAEKLEARAEAIRAKYQ
jgi:DNA-binding MurR/RpiR family transcriptional regulator